MISRIFCGAVISCIMLALGILSAEVSAGPFVAYSMLEAQQRAMRGGVQATEVANLGGMNVIAGMVYDEARRDLIIVGQKVEGYPPVTLDDLVVAMRALLRYKTSPLVSIDPNEQTTKTGLQAVRFEGGIQNTEYGKDLLAADILLKKLSLDLESAGVPAVRSYLQICTERFEQQSGDHALTIGSRFWFYPEATFVEREGVFAVRELRVRVRTELVQVQHEGKAVQSQRDSQDENGVTFARTIDEHFNELSLRHPSLARLRGLISLVAVAQGMNGLTSPAHLRYWLEEYLVKSVETLKTYDLHVRTKAYKDGRGRGSQVEVSGGIELKAIIMSLQAGDVSALRKAVLKSRSDPHALTWVVPIDAWRIPWAAGFLPDAQPDRRVESQQDKFGFFLTMRSKSVDPLVTPGDLSTRVSFGTSPPPLQPLMPKFGSAPALPWQGRGQIGGVMLSSTARVDGLEQNGAVSAAIDHTTGSFNLIAQGQNIQVRDLDLRKFVTVLWAVYFGEEPPGISIDPISHDSPQQLVRFIGNIVDTSLARAMLDADYYMKRAAIGAERPPIFGFQSVDQLIGGHGIKYLGAGRRFWFIPTDMRFRRAGDALLFEGGRMTVMTEKLLRNVRGETDASDQAFAKFWTDHYWEFAAANPVYLELFEYAKMTALAKYLKESGVSLQWFLLANRHLVLKEKIPGSVPALRAPSQVLRGVQWVGGVNLGTDMSDKQPGRYVIDATAAAALRQVYARHGQPDGREAPAGGGGFSTVGDRAITARLHDGPYTIVPAKSLTGGTASRGLTFHTDLALRANGEPGIELIRYNQAGWSPGMFGAGWNLYLPYGIVPAGRETTKASKVAVQDAEGKTVNVDILVPQRMQVLDLVNGSRETLVYDAERFGVAAWVPPNGQESRFEGMAFLTDGSFLLFEKSGARFRFDARTRPTAVMFSATHAMHFTYEGSRIVSVEDTLGGKVRLDYDETGKIVRVNGPAGDVRYRYLGDELVSVQNAAGQKWSMIYNRDGSLDEVVLHDPRLAK